MLTIFVSSYCVAASGASHPGVAVRCRNYSSPLSGNYVIGGTDADFDSFEKVFKSLKDFGVKGPVNFIVKGSYEIPSLKLILVKGISEINSITFIGKSGATLNCKTKDKRSLIDLDGAKYITFQNLKFENHFGEVIHFNNGCSHIQFKNCEFVGSKEQDLVVFDDSQKENYYNSFYNNSFKGGESAITFLDGSRHAEEGKSNAFAWNVFEDQEMCSISGRECQKDLIFAHNVLEEKEIQDLKGVDSLLVYDNSDFRGTTNPVLMNSNIKKDEAVKYESEELVLNVSEHQGVDEGVQGVLVNKGEIFTRTDVLAVGLCVSGKSTDIQGSNLGAEGCCLTSIQDRIVDNSSSLDEVFVYKGVGDLKYSNLRAFNSFERLGEQSSSSKISLKQNYFISIDSLGTVHVVDGNINDGKGKLPNFDFQFSLITDKDRIEKLLAAQNSSYCLVPDSKDEELQSCKSDIASQDRPLGQKYEIVEGNEIWTNSTNREDVPKYSNLRSFTDRRTRCVFYSMLPSRLRDDDEFASWRSFIVDPLDEKILQSGYSDNWTDLHLEPSPIKYSNLIHYLLGKDDRASEWKSLCFFNKDQLFQDHNRNLALDYFRNHLLKRRVDSVFIGYPKHRKFINRFDANSPSKDNRGENFSCIQLLTKVCQIELKYICWSNIIETDSILSPLNRSIHWKSNPDVWTNIRCFDIQRGIEDIYLAFEMEKFDVLSFWNDSYCLDCELSRVCFKMPYNHC